MPPLPAAPVKEHDDRVPAEFWDCFWSGIPARDLRISTDGLYIAEALIGGRDPHARAWARRRARRRGRPRRDPHARAWAINTLPVAILIECRKLRGCDTGTPRRWLNCAIEHRSDG
ncbi:MAG: hypothetical protein OXL98_08680 [Acidimicrobiaceae bacterium]|nr:hypothetical protein [Acidimicrobiaceae bacterium]